jgi:hypothetical protein
MKMIWEAVAILGGRSVLRGRCDHVFGKVTALLFSMLITFSLPFSAPCHAMHAVNYENGNGTRPIDTARSGSAIQSRQQTSRQS